MWSETKERGTTRRFSHPAAASFSPSGPRTNFCPRQPQRALADLQKAVTKNPRNLAALLLLAGLAYYVWSLAKRKAYYNWPKFDSEDARLFATLASRQTIGSDRNVTPFALSSAQAA